MARPRKQPLDSAVEQAAAPIAGEPVDDHDDPQAADTSLSDLIQAAQGSPDVRVHAAVHSVAMALTDLKARAVGQVHLPADIAARIATL